MNTNPFEDADAVFKVLQNAEGQCSLWPHDIAVPAGWQSIFGPDGRSACLEFIDRHWIDIAPKNPQ